MTLSSKCWFRALIRYPGAALQSHAPDHNNSSTMRNGDATQRRPINGKPGIWKASARSRGRETGAV